MARRPTIEDDTILEAAREVFLRRGIAATTAEVAAHAGISEGSIFRRWKTKSELFGAAMNLDMAPERLATSLTALVGVGDLKENLVSLGHSAIEELRSVVPVVMMSWSNPCNAISGGSSVDETNPPMLRVLRSLSAYFEAEMRLGRMRRFDPEILARTFMGSMWNFVMLEIVFASRDRLPMPSETFVRGFVEVQWAAVDPAPKSMPDATRSS